jgi:dolichol-phosphate mannosyltransferase
LLIFDDGSTDRTGLIADRLAVENQHIKVVHNPRNMGFGYNFNRGAELARMDYVTFFPGDNEVPGNGFRAMLEAAGSTEIVVCYLSNVHARTWSRRLISAGFVDLINLLFGLKLRYYNGLSMYPRTLLESVPLQSNGFACLAATLVRLIRSGHSYIEIPFETVVRRHGRTKAFRLKNVMSVLGTIARLFWDVRIRNRRKYPGAQRVRSEHERLSCAIRSQ